MSHATYRSPLAERYASQAMLELWSSQTRHGLWRRLWVALAEGQRALGVDISEQALTEMRAHLDDIDFNKAAEYEQRFRHDVMAHIHAYGDVAPAAKGVIHLGAAAAGVMMVPIPRRGIFSGVRGLEEARAVPGVTGVTLTAEVGQIVAPPPDGGSYLGFIFAAAATPADVEAVLRLAHTKLDFDIRPDYAAVPGPAG